MHKKKSLNGKFQCGKDTQMSLYGHISYTRKYFQTVICCLPQNSPSYIMLILAQCIYNRFLYGHIIERNKLENSAIQKFLTCFSRHGNTSINKNAFLTYWSLYYDKGWKNFSVMSHIVAFRILHFCCKYSTLSFYHKNSPRKYIVL